MRSCVRTELLLSRRRGRSGGRMTLVGWGGGLFVGREESAVVRWERESRRWVSEREVRRERWWVNWEAEDGAERVRDCWFRVMAFVC